jgi:hypothetical protein
MSAIRCSRPSSSTLNVTFTLAMFVFTTAASAQQSPQLTARPDSPPDSQQTSPGEPQNVTIPVGTRFALVLTHPVDSRTTHRDDQVFAQLSAPVVIDDQVVIPPGAFIQGRVENMTRQGSRALISLQSASIAFPGGYVAHIQTPVNIESDEGTAFSNPSGAAKAGILIAPFAGSGIGALIGSAAHTTQSSSLGGMTITSSSPKGLAIGSITGLAAGAAVSLVLLARSHHFYMEEGSPVEMSLPQPVTLSQAQVSDSNRAAAQSPVPVIARRPPPPSILIPADTGTCYTPGSPGTPGTYIPGTPPIGDSPGTPGTYLPGTPDTPPIPHPCP